MPLKGLKLSVGSTDLLANLVDSKEGAGFCPLTLYLPRGVEYASSAGNFRIDAEGKVIPGPGSRFKDGRFILEEAAAAAQAEPVGKGYWVFTHNLRRVLKRGEIARFQIIASGDYPRGPVEVVLRSGPNEIPDGRRRD